MKLLGPQKEGESQHNNTPFYLFDKKQPKIEGKHPADNKNIQGIPLLF